jgi:cytochrome c oxidase subunit 2
MLPALVALASLAATACNGTSSYLDATGTSGREEGVLGIWLTAAACIVVALVSLAVVLGIARHRGEHNAPESAGGDAHRAAGAAPHDERADGGAESRRREIQSGLNWIYIGTAVTLVVLLASFAGTMTTLSAASSPPLAASLVMDVTAHQWWWEVTYSDPTHPDLAFTTANEVHLPIGLPVRVRLRTADVIHSFWLPQIAGKMDVVPGQVNETWVEASTPGVTRGMCGEYCGLQHAAMAMTVVAESPQQFDAWARQRRSVAAPPTSPDAVVGRVVFARTCGSCHTVAGTDALGRIGPDLTHVASRTTIGAGALANTPANLISWITDAPAIKEGARMPAIPLDTDQMRAVVAYLETLH